MENNKPIVYIDMDDTIADFFKAAKDDNLNVDESKMYIDGFFENLEPIPGALTGVRRIMRLGYDVWILTQPLAESAASYQEKVRWINKWFPELNGKIVMTQDKGLHRGNYLIDDNATKWKDRFEASPGQSFIHFKYVRSFDQNISDKVHEDMWREITDNLTP